MNVMSGNLEGDGCENKSDDWRQHPGDQGIARSEVREKGMNQMADWHGQQCREKDSDKGKGCANRALPPTGQRNRHHQENSEYPNGHTDIKGHFAKNARRK